MEPFSLRRQPQPHGFVVHLQQFGLLPVAAELGVHDELTRLAQEAAGVLLGNACKLGGCGGTTGRLCAAGPGGEMTLPDLNGADAALWVSHSAPLAGVQEHFRLPGLREANANHSLQFAAGAARHASEEGEK